MRVPETWLVRDAVRGPRRVARRRSLGCPGGGRRIHTGGHRLCSSCCFRVSSAGSHAEQGLHLRTGRLFGGPQAVSRGRVGATRPQVELGGPERLNVKTPSGTRNDDRQDPVGATSCEGREDALPSFAGWLSRPPRRCGRRRSVSRAARDVVAIGALQELERCWRAGGGGGGGGRHAPRTGPGVVPRVLPEGCDLLQEGRRGNPSCRIRATVTMSAVTEPCDVEVVRVEEEHPKAGCFRRRYRRSSAPADFVTAGGWSTGQTCVWHHPCDQRAVGPRFGRGRRLAPRPGARSRLLDRRPIARIASRNRSRGESAAMSDTTDQSPDGQCGGFGQGAGAPQLPASDPPLRSPPRSRTRPGQRHCVGRAQDNVYRARGPHRRSREVTMRCWARRRDG
jgi:hypothetical protein